MGKANAVLTITGRVSAAEALWYDTARWPTFVDGLHFVQRVDPEWPRERGTVVVWDSNPGGRGRVREEVVSYEARAGMTARVEDEAIVGTQEIAFQPAENDQVRVELRLSYELKAGGPLGLVTDMLFIRRAQRDSLRRTLKAFARELADEQRTS